MGFLKSKGRIPFITYIFTLVQVIVFIVEIVKNGKAPEVADGGSY
jgi:hypothetical protein